MTLLSNKLSFEFFPPKTDQGKENLLATAKTLSTMQPQFCSVTFGAGGSTQSGTIDTIKSLQAETSLSMAAHISCMGMQRDALVEILHTYKTMGVRRIIALRGDVPSGMGQMGELRFASELVALIREITGDYFHIDVAAYPEMHPQANNIQADIVNLKNKFLSGANSAITQYFFNPDAYFYYRDACAKQGITQPIMPGIMPITQFSRLVQFSQQCGADIPRWLCKRLESYGDDTASIKAFGVEVIAKLCRQLLEGGAPGLHFYTLNQSEACFNIMDALSISSADHVLRNNAVHVLPRDER